MMDLDEALKGRRSIRNYLAEDVPKKLVRKLSRQQLLLLRRRMISNGALQCARERQKQVSKV
ncbi:MAG: hypothetical protein OEY88_08200 [Candidatus Bathyarchaeota archaeon]|nr:hypothetical protein [Candidatus Bathyarchaeota archaeon]